jgi:hypothetical protein
MDDPGLFEKPFRQVFIQLYLFSQCCYISCSEHFFISGIGNKYLPLALVAFHLLDFVMPPAGMMQWKMRDAG